MSRSKSAIFEEVKRAGRKPARWTLAKGGLLQSSPVTAKDQGAAALQFLAEMGYTVEKETRDGAA